MATLELDRVLQRRLLFVGGKGGVGKTTVASAMGLMAARGGQRCLVVSTDPAHSLGDIFDQQIGDRTTALSDRLWGLEIDPDAEAERYVAAVTTRMKQFAAPELHHEVERQMAMARTSPGASEAALLERVSRIMVDGPDAYDLVIFDTAPTGHTLRLLSLPEAMAEWTDGLLASSRRSETLGEVLQHLAPRKCQADLAGPFDDPQKDSLSGLDRRTRGVAEALLERRRLFYRSRRMLLDEDVTAFVFVLTPERLSILETARAMNALTRSGIPIAGAIINRVLPSLAGDFLQQRLEQQALHMHRIAAELSHLPTMQLPMLPHDVHGVASLNQVADHLTSLI